MFSIFSKRLLPNLVGGEVQIKYIQKRQYFWWRGTDCILYKNNKAKRNNLKDKKLIKQNIYNM